MTDELQIVYDRQSDVLTYWFKPATAPEDSNTLEIGSITEITQVCWGENFIGVSPDFIWIIKTPQICLSLSSSLVAKCGGLLAKHPEIFKREIFLASAPNEFATTPPFMSWLRGLRKPYSGTVLSESVDRFIDEHSGAQVSEFTVWEDV